MSERVLWSVCWIVGGLGWRLVCAIRLRDSTEQRGEEVTSAQIIELVLEINDVPFKLLFYRVTLCRIALSLDLSNTDTSKDGERKLVEVGELVLVRGLGEVADVGDVHGGLAEVVLCAYSLATISLSTSNCDAAKLTLAKVHVSINLKVACGTAVGRVLGNDKTVGGSGSPGLAEEGVGLDEHLVVGAALDGLVAVVDVEVVVDMLVAEAAGGTTGAAVTL